MTKQEADDLMSISISLLKKSGYFDRYFSGILTWTRRGPWGESKNGVRVSVLHSDKGKDLGVKYIQTNKVTGEKEEFDYKIPLTTTPCNLGGERYWFVCPWYKNGMYCGKRVGTIYKAGDYFACRHCYNLSYASRNVNRRHKLFPISKFMGIGDKIEKLENEITVRYYKGRPTRKYRKLLRLYVDRDTSYELFDRIEHELLL